MFVRYGSECDSTSQIQLTQNPKYCTLAETTSVALARGDASTKYLPAWTGCSCARASYYYFERQNKKKGFRERYSRSVLGVSRKVWECLGGREASGDVQDADSTTPKKFVS